MPRLINQHQRSRILRKLQTRLADALERVRARAAKAVVKAATLKRADKELLLKLGYLQAICKGWYLLARP
jgi:hypothetical protein